MLNTKPTVPERIAALMGDSLWDAGKMERTVRETGEPLKSGNLRAYISSIFSATLIVVYGPDGSALLDHKGQPVRAHRFTKVERGWYRVSTTEDVQNEVKALLGKSDVEIAAVPREPTPADEMFEELGIDIRPALEADLVRTYPRRVQARAKPTVAAAPSPDARQVMFDTRREVMRLATKLELETCPGILRLLATDLTELADKLGS